MVSGSDAQTGGEVVGHSPDGRLRSKRNPKGGDAAVKRNENDQRDIEPVDVLVPVRLGDGSLGDVDFLRVILGVSVGLCGFGHWRRLRGEVLWLHGQVTCSGLRRRHVEHL